MITRNTVVVLGAGASQPYGCPLGASLAEDIARMSVAELSATRRPSIDWDLVHGFETAFRGSQSRSIDAFLAQRSEFAEIGKGAIASKLLAAESEDALFGRPDDDWMQYLVDEMEAPWDDMPKNRISFVTFNYDRTLEHYLIHTWSHRFGRSQQECALLVSHFPIVHVYGQLGSLSRGAQFVPFGGRSGDAGYREVAAQGIKVLPEGRDDSPEFESARQLIADAEAKVFLGFGFDRLNVTRLGGQAVFGRGVNVTAAATAFRLTKAEIGRVAGWLSLPPFSTFLRQSLIDCRCRELLRESLILNGS